MDIQKFAIFMSGSSYLFHNLTLTAMDISSLIICAGVGLVVFYITSRAWGLSKDAGHLPLPPGPKGLPLIGNLNDLPGPGVFEAEHWLKHKELYGSPPTSSPKQLQSGEILTNT